MTKGDDILNGNKTPAARMLKMLVLGTLALFLVIPVVNGELLLTDPGEDPNHTEDTDHYSGTLNGSDSITLNTPAIICGHYGMPVRANINYFKYFNGNTTTDGIFTGGQSPYTATLNRNQTYYQYVAESALCVSPVSGDTILKPYRYWDNGNYLPPSGQLLTTDPGESGDNTEYSDHYSGTINGSETVTETTPSEICGHYGMWMNRDLNLFLYFNGNTTTDGINAGSHSPVYTATLDRNQTYYQHVAEAALCVSPVSGSTILKPYRYWDNGNYTPPSGQLLTTDPGEGGDNTEYSDHYSGDLFCGENITLYTPSEICGHYGMWMKTDQNLFLYFNGNTTTDGINTGTHSPVYTATFDCSKTGFSHVAEAALCVSPVSGSTILKPYRYWNTSYISTAPLTNFTASPLSGPAPLTVNFTDTSTGAPANWTWDFGDSQTSNEQNPSHIYTTAGNYTISHSATNPFGTSWKNVTDYITVTGQGPVADFTATPTSGNAPLTVAFTDTSTGSPISWSWSFGDSGTSTEQNPSHIYEIAGTYDVSLTAANGVGSNATVKDDYITVTGGGPVADFSADPTSGNAPLDVQFTDLSTGNATSWSWNFGDGSYSTNQNPSHRYNDVGYYNVSLTVENEVGNNSEVKTNYIHVTGTSARYVFVETGIRQNPCSDKDAQDFNEALLKSDSHGWLDAPTPGGNPIYAPDARVEHWANGTSTDYIDKADFAYFHGHGSDDYSALFFENLDGSHTLEPNMARWGYEHGNSRIKWITFHACSSLNRTRWEGWKQSFNGLHMILGYNTSTICSNTSIGKVYAQLMRGEYPGYSVQSIQSAWILANQILYPSGNYEPAIMYVVGCESDYLPGFGGGGTCGNPQRNPSTNEYDIQYYPLPLSPLSYSTTSTTLQKTQDLVFTEGIYSVETKTVTIPEKIMIYKVVDQEKTVDIFNKLKIGLDNGGKEKGRATAEKSTISNRESQDLTIQKDTRIISYENSKLRKNLLETNNPRAPPSDKHAINTVTSLLTDVNLMPADAVADKPRYNAVERFTVSGNMEAVNQETIVYYHREMDGLLVENSRIMAEVNSDNEILSLFMNWRDYKPYMEVETKPVDVAFDEFTTRNLRDHSTNEPEKIVVTDVSLKYYSQPAAIKESYLQPVYVFEGYVEDGSSIKPFTPVYIPATVEQFDNIPGCEVGACR